MPAYAALTDHVCLYPGRVDACWLDDERVAGQPGDFYGGWITSEAEGPFKGGADPRLVAPTRPRQTHAGART